MGTGMEKAGLRAQDLTELETKPSAWCGAHTCNAITGVAEAEGS